MYTIKDGNDKILYSSIMLDTGLISGTVTQSENKPDSLSLTYTKDSILNGQFHMLSSIVKVYRDDELIFYGRPINRSSDFYGTISMDFEGELGFLYDSVQSNDDLSDKQPKEILEFLINKHNTQVDDWKKFTIGHVTVVDTTNQTTSHSDNPNDPYAMYPSDSESTTTLKCSYQKTFDEINTLLINRLGGFLRIRHSGGTTYVDYLKDYTDYNLNDGQIIEFGSNLLDYSDTISYGGICTGVIPLGTHNDSNPYQMYQTSDDDRLTVADVNGGSEIIWNQQLVNTYGKIIAYLDKSNISDPRKLLEAGQTYLNNTQFNNMTLNCKIVDLNIIDDTQQPIRFLDIIRVISKPHDLDRRFPVSEITHDLLNPANDTLTLGTTVNTLTENILKQETSLNSQNHSIQTNEHVINQNAKGWWKEVHDANGRSKFTILSDRITSEVTRIDNEAGTMNSKITQNAQSISSEVSRATQAEGNLSSKINQTADSIMSTVEAQGQSISSVKQTAEGVQFSVNDLKTGLSNGTTTINGGCITTGSIDADKIKTSYVSGQGDSVYFSSSIYVDGHIGSNSKITGGELVAGSSGIYSSGSAEIGSNLTVYGNTFLNNPANFGGTSNMRLLCVESGGGIVGEISWNELLSILDNHYQKKK